MLESHHKVLFPRATCNTLLYIWVPTVNRWHIQKEWSKDILLMKCKWVKEITKFGTIIQGSISRATDILRLKWMNRGIQYLNLERESQAKANLKEALIFDWGHRSSEVTHQKEDRGRNTPTSLQPAFLLQSPDQAPCWLKSAESQSEGSHWCSTYRSATRSRKQDKERV